MSSFAKFDHNLQSKSIDNNIFFRRNTYRNIVFRKKIDRNIFRKNIDRNIFNR